MFGTGICDKIHWDECKSETGTVLLENEEYDGVYKLNPKVSEEWEKVGTLPMNAFEFPLVVPFVKAFDPKQVQNHP